MSETKPVREERASIQMINLGCAKNEVDAEEMLGVLQHEGYSLGARSGRADVVIVNTCAFIESAKQESIDVILEAVERKKRGEVGKVIVTGCLSQRYGGDLAKELPEVDGFLGTGQMSQISGLVGNSLLRKDQLLQVAEKPHHRWLDQPTRVRTGSPWSAYLKISEGCDHRCTFCAIPSFRGDHVSKPIERILQEAEALVAQGVQEINLIAQDSTQYGYDLYGKPRLPDLLRQLSEIDGARWLRLFYCYPSRVNSKIIEAIATTPKVCQYIDMPLQHADEEVLRAMRRPANSGRYLEIVKQFREASPDVSLRTTFIVGFPGETEQHFDNLLGFIEDAQFDRVGVFEFSVEDGTPSADLPGKVPARTKRARRDKLMRLQQSISLERNRRWIGRTLEVVVEETGGVSSGRRKTVSEQGSSAAGLDAKPEPGFARGRSFREAPEIDGSLLVRGDNLVPGQFYNVRVTDAREYDLIAELIES